MTNIELISIKWTLLNQFADVMTLLYLSYCYTMFEDLPLCHTCHSWSQWLLFNHIRDVPLQTGPIQVRCPQAKMGEKSFVTTCGEQIDRPNCSQALQSQLQTQTHVLPPSLSYFHSI